MGYIDFHCHLDSDYFVDNIDSILETAIESGISTIVTVADPYEDKSHERSVEICKEKRNIFMMTAAHPHNAGDYSKEIEKKIIDFSTLPGAIGIGEAGLDFHYNFSTPDVQKEVFKRQIGIAKEMKMPLIIHSREAESEVMKMLEDESFNYPVIFHCYTGNIEDAREILARGYHISISGIVTFKKADYLREVVKIIPLDRIFTETDSPYLSPVPFRGKTNNPSMVKIVADAIAEIKEITVEELNENVKTNLSRLFKLKL